MSNITQLEAKIEELEKRIKALSLQVTTSSYFSIFKACLDDIKDVLQDLAEEYESYNSDISDHLDDYSALLTRVGTLEQSLTSHIQSCSSSVTEEEFEELEHEVEILQSELSGYGTIYDNRFSIINSGISGLGSRVNTLETSTESLESDVSTLQSTASTLSSKVTTLENTASTVSGQISTLQSTTSTISGQVSTLQSTTSTISGQVSTLNTTTSGLSTRVTSLEGDASDLNDRVSDLEDDTEDLDTRVTALENGSGSGSGSGGGQSQPTETIDSFYDTVIVYQNEKCTASSYVWTPRMHFYCDPTQVVHVEIRVKGTIATNATPISGSSYFMSIEMNNGTSWLSNSVVSTTQPEQTTGKFDYVIEGDFVPLQAHNWVRARMMLYTDYTMTEYQMKIFGKNVHFVTKEDNIKIECYDNKYYITKYTNNGYLLYGVQDKANLNLNDSAFSNMLATTGSTCYNNTFIVPNLKAQSTLEVDTSLPLAIVSMKQLDFGIYHTIDTSNTITSLYTNENFTFSSVDWLNGGIGYGGCGLFCTTLGESTSGSVRMYGKHLGANVIKPTINGEYLPSRFYSVSYVRTNSYSEGDTPSFKGFVAWREDNKNIFFPSINSTYSVDLGPGFNATAYYQTDGSINVYLNKGCSVYKYILQMNSTTNQYELSSTVVEMGKMTRYLELYDNKGLVIRCGKYEVVQN